MLMVIITDMVIMPDSGITGMLPVMKHQRAGDGRQSPPPLPTKHFLQPRHESRPRGGLERV